MWRLSACFITVVGTFGLAGATSAQFISQIGPNVEIDWDQGLMKAPRIARQTSY